MPTERERTKQATRERIATVATRMFLDRGFDEVTVNEVAAQAGVSKVTVFAHFPQKEDLLLDRGPEATALLVDAVRRASNGASAIHAVRRLAERLVRQRHPLSGLSSSSRPFLVTLARSPALLSRARELADGLEATLAAELRRTGASRDDSALLAALTIAAYRAVLTDTARRTISGERESIVVAHHRRALASAFDVVEAAAATLASPDLSASTRRSR